MSDVLTKEQVAEVRRWRTATAGCESDIRAVCDSHEALRAEVERLTLEHAKEYEAHDYWQHETREAEIERDDFKAKLAEVTRERDEARASFGLLSTSESGAHRINALEREVAAMRPVVEAALAFDGSTHSITMLGDSLRAYRARSAPSREWLTKAGDAETGSVSARNPDLFKKSAPGEGT